MLWGMSEPGVFDPGGYRCYGNITPESPGAAALVVFCALAADDRGDSQVPRLTRLQVAVNEGVVSWPLDSALTFGGLLPPLNSISVGMPRMPYWAGVFWLSSMFSFGHLQFAGVFLGHFVQDRRDHLARTAPLGPVTTSTGCADCSTSAAKLSSVT